VIRISATTALTSISQLVFDEAISGYWHNNGYGNAPTTGARGQAYGAAMIQSGNESTNHYEDGYMSFHTCRDPHSDGVGGLGVLNERMRITSLGNVGIGTATPTSTLHVNGTFTCNNPIFSVVRSGAFSITSGVNTRVPYNVVDFDTNSGWNNSTYQYKPTVAGYYQFSWGVLINALIAGGTQEFFSAIYKNGTTYTWGTDLAPSTTHYSYTNGSCILYLNGSTDYVEIFVYQNSGGAVNIEPSAGAFPMRFMGYMLRS
jgi:hypothetical protein